MCAAHLEITGTERPRHESLYRSIKPESECENEHIQQHIAEADACKQITTHLSNKVDV